MKNKNRENERQSKVSRYTFAPQKGRGAISEINQRSVTFGRKTRSRESYCKILRYIQA